MHRSFARVSITCDSSYATRAAANANFYSHELFGPHKLDQSLIPTAHRPLNTMTTPPPFFLSHSPTPALPLPPCPNRRHLLLACTGSVATIKLPALLTLLTPHTPTLAIILLLTPTAIRFLTPSPPYSTSTSSQPLSLPISLATHFSRYTSTGLVVGVFQNEDEWVPPWTRGAGVLHIELRKWADLFLVAPLSADSMAEMVHGGCKGIVSAVLRAWDTRARDGKGARRVLVCPAMNTAMWEHPVTEKLLVVLEGEWGVKARERERGWSEGEANGRYGDGGGWVEVLRPATKKLACGDVGVGAMVDVEVIVEVVVRRLGLGG